jgi:hypothetical protein
MLGLMAVRAESWTPNCREGGCGLAFGCGGLRLEGTVGADSVEGWLGDWRTLDGLGLRWCLRGLVSGCLRKLEDLVILTPRIECTNV